MGGMPASGESDATVPVMTKGPRSRLPAPALPGVARPFAKASPPVPSAQQPKALAPTMQNAKAPAPALPKHSERPPAPPLPDTIQKQLDAKKQAELQATEAAKPKPKPKPPVFEKAPSSPVARDTVAGQNGAMPSEGKAKPPKPRPPMAPLSLLNSKADAAQRYSMSGEGSDKDEEEEWWGSSPSSCQQTSQPPSAAAQASMTSETSGQELAADSGLVCNAFAMTDVKSLDEDKVGSSTPVLSGHQRLSSLNNVWEQYGVPETQSYWWYLPTTEAFFMEETPGPWQKRVEEGTLKEYWMHDGTQEWFYRQA